MHARSPLWHAAASLAATPLLVLAGTVPFRAQVSPAPAGAGVGTADASLGRVIGEVTATTLADGQIALKLDVGGAVTIMLQDKTVYLRVPPGETDLKKAAKITASEISVGDRVYARGRLAEDQKSIAAVTIIVMTKADLAQKREQERAEWQKRTFAGTVSALNPKTEEITLSVRSPEGTAVLTVERSPTVVFRRYAPDSVRFGEARPSSFAELHVGDSLRILGDGNSDGTRIKPEEIVSGSFRNITGMVNAIDAAAGELKITDLQGRRPLTVRITSDTILRRMPQAKAATVPKRPQGEDSKSAPVGKQPAEGKQLVEAKQPAEGRSAPSAAQPERQTRASEPSPRPAGSAATGGGGQLDPERMPVVSFGDLKREEAVLVLCTAGADPARVTAIVVVAGVEPLLGPAPKDQTETGRAWNFFDIKVP